MSTNIIYSVQQDNLTTDMGITPIFPTTIEDNSKDFVGDAVIAGQCLALSSVSTLVLGDASTAVYGLAKNTVNMGGSSAANINEVSDNGFGIFGSGKITASIFGVFEVKNFNYSKADGSVVPFNAIDFTTLSTATPGASVGSTAAGLITVVEDSAASKFGRLIAVADDGNTVQVSVGF